MSMGEKRDKPINRRLTTEQTNGYQRGGGGVVMGEIGDED